MLEENRNEPKAKGEFVFPGIVVNIVTNITNSSLRSISRSVICIEGVYNIAKSGTIPTHSCRE